MKILGIESSCDETAMAVVDENKVVYSHITASQIANHQKYGGVVPEIASRSHLSAIRSIYDRTMQEAKLNIDHLDAIAVTAGPGLIGGLLIGVMFAKGLALAADKPLIAINHLEAHALTLRSCQDVPFPYLMLLVSGGHCQILEVLGLGQYKMLGRTRDDAVGEAFDKVARMLGLPYPGGPQIEKLAKLGSIGKIKLPTPLLKDAPYDFSFSGLKTAAKRYLDSIQLTDEILHDFCASFQETIAYVLCDRLLNAACEFEKRFPHNHTLVIAGGVAANQYIKARIQEALPTFHVIAPPVKLCTDNGLMVAWAGMERLKCGMIDTMDFEAVSRWPLEQMTNRQ